jgi:hypothetical protein
MEQLLAPPDGPGPHDAPRLDLDSTSVALLHLVWLIRRQDLDASTLPELAPLVQQLADAVQSHLPAVSPKHLAEHGWALGELRLRELAPGHPAIAAWLQVCAPAGANVKQRPTTPNSPIGTVAMG